MNTAGDIVKDKNRPIVCVAHDETVHRTCQVMVEKKIGAVIVKKGDDFAGIWTERDLLRKIADEGFDPKKELVGDYMSSPIRTASHDTSILKLQEMFLGLFVRHLVIEKEGRHIGFISIGDVLRASLIERDQQYKKLNELVSWDYYENWSRGRKKMKR